MAAVTDDLRRDELRRDFTRLADEAKLCLQCGACTSSCPNQRDLNEGPRRLMRLLLAGEIEATLVSHDLWRCSECGSCTEACRMEVDVAALLVQLRDLERRHGDQSCPERRAADVATRRLNKRGRIGNLAFGMTMARKGHIPNDIIGAAGAFFKIVGQSLNRMKWPGVAQNALKASSATTLKAATTASPSLQPATLPFYAGCSLPQDGAAHRLTHKVAAGFGLALDETPAAACCGHPSRGAAPTRFSSAERVYTACPACDASLREAEIETVPLWEALVDHAQRHNLRLSAAADTFVPYIGCLADRDAALASLAGAAELSGARLELAYPSLHSACCGALGGTYRGESAGTKRLLDFAAERGAPVVTTCLLCRDNLRSAARRRRLSVRVHFWPEFFRAAAPTPEESHA